MEGVKTEKNLSENFINLPNSIGQYEIKEQFNEGLYSKIYLGISKYTNDKVSIKIINKSSFAKNPYNLIFIKNEIEVLKILKHRNILTLYEIYESSDYIFIVTEYLPSDLISLITTKKRLNESDALNIFIQLIDAFQYMHNLKICHRDMIIEHIMFDSHNIPKIIDFGYSTFYKKGENLDEPIGSLLYSCPEIIQEQTYDPELADVWSLGVCLYTMICGYLPFSEEDDEKNKELIIKGKIEYPSEIGNICKDLLKKMLEINPKKRINILKITRHPWFKSCKDVKILGGYNIYDMIYPIDERLIKIMKEFGFDEKKVKDDLNNNKYNTVTGLYKIISKKMFSLSYGSISDFTSDAFVEYMKDKKNSIADGAKKYEEYLDKIYNKNEQFEKIVSDYKIKQKDAISKLDELKSTSINDSKKGETNNDAIKKENNIKKEELIVPDKEENKLVLSKNEEKEDIKSIKSDEDKENNEEMKKPKREMRFSLSFDDEEGSEKSDNEDNKDDDNKSEEKSESKDEEKEKEKEENIIDEEPEKKEPNLGFKKFLITKEKEKPNNNEEIPNENNKNIDNDKKEKRIIKIIKDINDSRKVKINIDIFRNTINDIEKMILKKEEQKEKEKKKEEIKNNLISEKQEKNIINNNIEIIPEKDKNEKVDTLMNDVKETKITETKETLPDIEKDILFNKKENDNQSDNNTIEENEYYLKMSKEKTKKVNNINILNNNKLNDGDKKIIKKDKEIEKEKEEIIKLNKEDKENKLDINNTIQMNPKKTVISIKKNDKEKIIKTNKNNEKKNILENDENYLNNLLPKNKKQNQKKSKIKNNDIDNQISLDKKGDLKIDIENDRVLLRNNKHHKNPEQNEKIIQKNENKNNKNILNNLMKKSIIAKNKKPIEKSDVKLKEKSKEKQKNENFNNINYYINNKRNINLEKKIKESLMNINMEKVDKIKEKPKKFETISQYKEKQENKIKNKNHKNKLSSPKRKILKKSLNKSPKERYKEKDKELEKSNNLCKSQKSIRKRKKIIEQKNDLNEPKLLNSYINQKNSSKILTISHVNNINYLGNNNHNKNNSNNNYFYLKNRNINLKHQKQSLNQIKGEFKNNNKFYDDDYLGNDLYTNIANKKNNNYDDIDINRQLRLEEQKNKLKEELRKTNLQCSYSIRNNNNNPINKKEMKYKNDEDILDEYKSDNKNKQKIKIFHNKRNNKLKGKRNIKLNKNGRNKNNWDNQYSINNMTNKDLQTTTSINTKIKNDPLKYITQYYLAKDKLNKITNSNKKKLEHNNNKLMNESIKYKNINFQEIIKIIKNTKNNNLETKLNKFKDKQEKKINNQLFNSKIQPNIIINNYSSYSPFKISFNPNFRSINMITESNMNPSLSTAEVNYLYRNNNFTTSKKKKYKRIISMPKNKKIRNDKSFGNAERRLSSCKRMCKVCNKSFSENNNSSENLRYGIYQSNSMSDRYRRIKE